MSSRAIDLQDGMAMVVTDLHGVGWAYARMRKIFLAMHSRGQVQRLILCGDLIHGYGSDNEDYSLNMIVDVMRLQEQFGADQIIMLLGNHEMPHIYGIPLAKGDLEFTARFENALARMDADPAAPYRRKQVIDFLMKLPFYVRTKGGVLVSHAGAPAAVRTPGDAERLLAIDHTRLLEQADGFLKQFDFERLYTIYELRTGVPYADHARQFLAVKSADDPRYNDLLRGMVYNKVPDFALLWDALFTSNEQSDGIIHYSQTVARFLHAMTVACGRELRVLLAGHISARNGYEAVGSQQLRLATYAHAVPQNAGRYLLLDCAKRVESPADLVPQLRLAAPVVTKVMQK